MGVSHQRISKILQQSCKLNKTPQNSNKLSTLKKSKAQITEEKIKLIMELRDKGWNQERIAEKMGLTKQRISQVILQFNQTPQNSNKLSTLKKSKAQITKEKIKHAEDWFEKRLS